MSLSSLPVWKKLAGIGILSIAAASFPTALYVSQAVKTLSITEQELAGTTPVHLSLDWLQKVQQHRGISAALLAGNDALQSQRAEKQRETDAALDALKAAIPRSATKAHAQLDKAAADWKALAADVARGGLPVGSSFARHSSLVKEQLLAIDIVLDEYGLSLDPNVDSYYMISAAYMTLPHLAEAMGQARAKGAGMLSAKQASVEDRVALSLILDRVKERAEQSNGAFEKAFAGNPALKTKIAPTLQAANAAVKEVSTLAQKEILDVGTLSFSSAAYVDVTTRAIDAQFALIRESGTITRALLEEQTQSQTSRLAMLLGAVGALLACGVGFSVWVARSLLRELGGEPGEAVRLAQRVAQGDLSVSIDVKPTDTGSLVAALKQMQDSLSGIVSSVRRDAEAVASASGQITQGTVDLSSRTEEQASALQQTSASMKELASTVQRNAQQAQEGNRIAADASAVAGEGGQVMTQVVHTMREIHESSKKIADIIAVIDGISFQTNILALNAAVEAARAGEQGRGFAVVAGEVRNLAQRSAQAASEIKQLITSSVERVDHGSELVTRAGGTMEQVVASIQRVCDLMSGISAASREQSQGVAQVGDAVSQMDAATQQNAALVEESAAASESLKQQASKLVEAVSLFKLRMA